MIVIGLLGIAAATYRDRLARRVAAVLERDRVARRGLIDFHLQRGDGIDDMGRSKRRYARQH
jgi:hypothetical protein